MATIRLLSGLYLGSRRAGLSRGEARRLVALLCEGKVGFDKTLHWRRRFGIAPIGPWLESHRRSA